MAAHLGSQGRLVRQPWQSRAMQVLAALFCLALPLFFVPSALQEEAVGLWVRAGLPKSVVRKLVLPGGTASFRYALVVGEGVYRAPGDPGTAWQAIDRDLPSRRWSNVEAQTLAADARDPSVIYVGMGGAGSRDPARSAGLYMTNDSGQTWQSPVKSIAGEEVQVIAVMPTARDLAAGGNSGEVQPAEADSVVCAATVGAIYCNTGVSQSWVRLDWRGTERVLSMAIRPDDPSTIYIGTAGFGLVSSTNGGASWKQSHADLQNRHVYDIAMPVSRPDVLYVATDNGLFVSADAGSTWGQFGDPIEGRRVNTIALCPESLASGEAGALSARVSGEQPALCVGLQHGAVYRSIDGGQSWAALNKGLGNMTVLSLAVDPQDPAVLWAGTADGVWRCNLPVTQSTAVAAPPTTGPVPSHTAEPRPSPTARPQPSPTVRLQRSPVAGLTATPGLLTPPEPSLTLTRTVQPTVTPTLSPTATRTAAPTRVPPTATRTAVVPPTLTPSPTPTSTEAPLPSPEKPRPSPTRVPR